MNIDLFSPSMIQGGMEAKDIHASLEVELLSDARHNTFDDYLDVADDFEDSMPRAPSNTFQDPVAEYSEQLSIEVVNRLSTPITLDNKAQFKNNYSEMALSIAPSHSGKATGPSVAQVQETITPREALNKKVELPERNMASRSMPRVELTPTFYKIIRAGSDKVSDVYIRGGKGVLSSQLLEIKNQISKLVGAVRHFFYNGAQ